MSPVEWAALGLVLALLCLLAEVFIETSRDREDRVRADVEELLRKANKEVTERPRIRAGATQISATQSPTQRTSHD